MTQASKTYERGNAHPYHGKPPKTKFEAIALGIIANLCDRRGIKSEMRQVDECVRNTLVRDLAEIIEYGVYCAFLSPPAQLESALGIEAAAKLIDKKAEGYIQEFGNYDPSTGVYEFSNAGEEYLGTLAELAEEIRALKAEGAQ